MAQDTGLRADPCRVALQVSNSIEADAALAVFRSGVRDDGSWGQVLISSVHADGASSVLHQASFGERGRYFYPASTVKLYAAIAACEKINDLARAHSDDGAGTTPSEPRTRIDEHTPLRMHPLFEGETVREVTVSDEAHKLFVVSDNPAFNTLYDFVGQDDLDRRIRRWGAQETQIVHRLAIGRTEAENRRAARVDVGLGPGAPQIGERVATMTHTRQPDTGFFLLGDGFLRGGEVVRGPFDFSDKNYTTLHDLQLVLARLVRPDITGLDSCPDIAQAGVSSRTQAGPLVGRPLDLTEAQRAGLIASATVLPRESVSPEYDPAAYPDDHVKFLLPGLLRVRPLEEWRIVNKIGLAYGFVTENAYVEHRPTGRAVFVAAVIHRNPNGIYNDNQYDYDTTLAEMATLGEVVGRALVDGAP